MKTKKYRVMIKYDDDLPAVRKVIAGKPDEDVILNITLNEAYLKKLNEERDYTLGMSIEVAA